MMLNVVVEGKGDNYLTLKIICTVGFFQLCVGHERTLCHPSASLRCAAQCFRSCGRLYVRLATIARSSLIWLLGSPLVLEYSVSVGVS